MTSLENWCEIFAQTAEAEGYENMLKHLLFIKFVWSGQNVDHQNSAVESLKQTEWLMGVFAQNKDYVISKRSAVEFYREQVEALNNPQSTPLRVQEAMDYLLYDGVEIVGGLYFGQVKD